MNIAIIGTGHVGSSLGTGFADKGHRVTFGSRNPSQQRLTEWVAKDPQHRRVDTSANAIGTADIVVVAVPGRVLAETVREIGPAVFDGKIVIDATNPFGQDDDGRPIDIYGDDDSGAELLQRELRGARVVKAFNEINAPVMLRPNQVAGGTMRIAGDNADAKQQVTELLESFGWKLEDDGALSHARELEHAVIARYS